MGRQLLGILQNNQNGFYGKCNAGKKTPVQIISYHVEKLRKAPSAAY